MHLLGKEVSDFYCPVHFWYGSSKNILWLLINKKSVFRWWLGANRRQAITLSNVDWHVWRHLASLDHSKLRVAQNYTCYTNCSVLLLVRHHCGSTASQTIRPLRGASMRYMESYGCEKFNRPITNNLKIYRPWCILQCMLHHGGDVTWESGVSDHRPLLCLFSSLVGLISMICLTVLCEKNPPVISALPSQKEPIN